MWMCHFYLSIFLLMNIPDFSLLWAISFSMQKQELLRYIPRKGIAESYIYEGVMLQNYVNIFSKVVKAI